MNLYGVMATIRLKQLKSRDYVLLQEKLTSDGHDFFLSRVFIDSLK